MSPFEKHYLGFRGAETVEAPTEAAAFLRMPGWWIRCNATICPACVPLRRRPN
jgi:hypothetical protein